MMSVERCGVLFLIKSKVSRIDIGGGLNFFIST